MMQVQCATIAPCCRPGISLTVPRRSNAVVVRRPQPLTSVGGEQACIRSSAASARMLTYAVQPHSSGGQPAASSRIRCQQPAAKRGDQLYAAQSDVLASVDVATLLPSTPSNGQGTPGGGSKPEPPTAGDHEKEDSRKYRRTVFDFERWRAHRSTTRYRRHIFGLLESRIVRGLAGPLWFIVGLSTFVGVYESLREAGILPAYFSSISISNTAPFNLSSFALSLLLVFRTNSSYSRWDEARKIWGSVTNRSRDLVRQAESWMPAEDQDLLDMVNRWTIAIPRSMMAHLREDGNLEADLKGILPEPELRALLAASHRPNYVFSVLSTAIEEAQVPDAARVRMDENMTSFADAIGKCERILKTPIPLTYTRHTSRFLVIWLTFMPFTLWNAYHWGSIPASAAISFLLLGIEEIGVQIEEPFSILPLEAMCSTIQGNVLEMHQKRLEVRSLVRSNKTTEGADGVSDPRPNHERNGESSRPLFRSPEQMGR